MKVKQRLLEAWTAITNAPRARWRWLGYGLTAAGLLYVAVLLVRGGGDLRLIDWQAYLPASVIVLALYLASLILQFVVWVRVLSPHRAPDWTDVEIYARMILTRRLPGGIWHWVGRAAMYTAATQLPTRVVLSANLLEWLLLVLVGFGYALTNLVGPLGPYRWLLAGAVWAGAVGLATLWQPGKRRWWARLAEGAGWVALYAASWALGGLILFLYAQAGGAAVGLPQATQVWALSGAIGLIVTLIPAVLGIQEITLTVLLQRQMPPATALVIALLLRVAFTLADVLWGLVGWGLSAAILRRQARVVAKP